MKERVKAWVPYGLDADPVLHRMAMGLLGCVLVSLRCPISCAQGWDKLYKLEGGRKVLRTGVTMLPFRELVSWSFMGFGLFFAAMAVLAAYYVLYHRQGGSRTDYLMRRMPDRWEYLRRCLALPGLGCAAALVLAVLLWTLYFWMYLRFTPAGCLPPEQWTGFWRAVP